MTRFILSSSVLSVAAAAATPACQTKCKAGEPACNAKYGFPQVEWAACGNDAKYWSFLEKSCTGQGTGADGTNYAIPETCTIGGAMTAKDLPGGDSDPMCTRMQNYCKCPQVCAEGDKNCKANYGFPQVEWKDCESARGESSETDKRYWKFVVASCNAQTGITSSTTDSSRILEEGENGNSRQLEEYKESGLDFSLPDKCTIAAPIAIDDLPGTNDDPTCERIQNYCKCPTHCFAGDACAATWGHPQAKYDDCKTDERYWKYMKSACNAAEKPEYRVECEIPSNLTFKELPLAESVSACERMVEYCGATGSTTGSMELYI